MLAAGTGVAWAARRLGLSVEAAIAAGLLYQLSPYLVPYMSRTSSMLLPWAGLGWIVGLTIGAATRTRWRDAALCALVIGTVGAVNTTALLMIAPAPVLWLARRRRRAHRDAACARWRLRRASAGWRSAPRRGGWRCRSIQGRKGADLLAYSESLEDVSLTATSVEAWRSLGYWLMYVRDPYAPTTTAGADYMTDLLPIICGFLLVVVGPCRTGARALPGAPLRDRHDVHRARARRGCPSVRRPVADRPSCSAATVRQGLSLALRSSTRALPLLASGWPSAAPRSSTPIGRVDRLAAGACSPPRSSLVALGNLPVLTGRGLVDPALERDEQPPAAWTAAAGGPRRAARRVPRAAPAGRRVRGVHLGVHRRSAAPRTDRPPARDPRSPPPRFPGGDGPARTPSTTASRSDRQSSRPSPRSPACSAPTRSGCQATPPSTASARPGRS